MKSRILFLFALILTLSFGFTAAKAQNEDVEELKAELALNGAQTKKWQAIDKNFKSQLQSIQQSGVAQEEKRDQIKSLRESRNAKLKQILSNEQWQKLLAYRKAKSEGN